MAPERVVPQDEPVCPAMDSSRSMMIYLVTDPESSFIFKAFRTRKKCLACIKELEDYDGRYGPSPYTIRSVKVED